MVVLQNSFNIKLSAVFMFSFKHCTEKKRYISGTTRSVNKTTVSHSPD